MIKYIRLYIYKISLKYQITEQTLLLIFMNLNRNSIRVHGMVSIQFHQIEQRVPAPMDSSPSTTLKCQGSSEKRQFHRSQVGQANGRS